MIPSSHRERYSSLYLSRASLFDSSPSMNGAFLRSFGQPEKLVGVRVSILRRAH